MPTIITAEESCFIPALDAGGGGGSQPTVSRALVLFANSTDPDDEKRWRNVFRDDPNYEDFVPNAMDDFTMDDFFSDNQIPSGVGPLTSSDLQKIESLGNESREAGTSSSRPDLVEEDDHALVDMNNGLEEIEHGNLYADEERVNIEVIDLDTLRSSDSGEIEHNLRPDNRGAETTVDHNCSRGAMRTERECGITLTDLQQQYGKKAENAAQSLGVSRSTFKRACRANGIARWSSKRLVQQPASASQSMATIFDQRDKSMSIKATYNDKTVRFELSLSSGKNDLEVEVEKRFRRFGLQTGSYWIKYEDEDRDWILITCDKDLHHGMQTCIERGIPKMKMVVNCDLG